MTILLGLLIGLLTLALIRHGDMDLVPLQTRLIPTKMSRDAQQRAEDGYQVRQPTEKKNTSAVSNVYACAQNRDHDGQTISRRLQWAEADEPLARATYPKALVIVYESHDETTLLSAQRLLAIAAFERRLIAALGSEYDRFCLRLGESKRWSSSVDDTWFDRTIECSPMQSIVQFFDGSVDLVSGEIFPIVNSTLRLVDCSRPPASGQRCESSMRRRIATTLYRYQHSRARERILYHVGDWSPERRSEQLDAAPILRSRLAFAVPSRWDGEQIVRRWIEKDLTPLAERINSGAMRPTDDIDALVFHEDLYLHETERLALQDSYALLYVYAVALLVLLVKTCELSLRRDR